MEMSLEVVSTDLVADMFAIPLPLSIVCEDKIIEASVCSCPYLHCMQLFSSCVVRKHLSHNDVVNVTMFTNPNAGMICITSLQIRVKQKLVCNFKSLYCD